MSIDAAAREIYDWCALNLPSDWTPEHFATILRKHFPAEPAAGEGEVAAWAQAMLTALNVGDVASGSPLHLKLRDVMIRHRGRLSEWRDHCLPSELFAVASHCVECEVCRRALMGYIETKPAVPAGLEAEREERLLGEMLDAFKAADDERLAEVEERHQEAAKWKGEGDMYGWNFHEGVAAGMTTASIIFNRVRRTIEAKAENLRAKGESDAS